MNNETNNEVLPKETGVKYSYPIPAGERMTTYKLREMNPETIAKYGLHKYTHTKAGEVK